MLLIQKSDIHEVGQVVPNGPVEEMRGELRLINRRLNTVLNKNHQITIIIQAVRKHKIKDLIRQNRTLVDQELHPNQ